MINYFKIVSCLLISLSVTNSCTSNHSNRMNIPAKECIKLNNDGVQYLTNYPMNGKKELDKAIDLFKQAITCDSTYTTAYIGLASAYDHKNSYGEEMITLNKLLKLVDNDPPILMWKGELFERMNHADSAKNMYYLAKMGYKKRLQKHPDNISSIEQLILLKALTDGKDEAIKELDEQIKNHPELSSKLSGQYVFYQYFDRHAFVFELQSEVPFNK